MKKDHNNTLLGINESGNKAKIDFDRITLKNDVMFSSVFRDPEDCRELLQRILGLQISEIMIAEEQKDIKTRPWNKGIRLDIYAKDTEGNVYDIEMQVLDTGELALRSRYYHGEMDSYQILAGTKYTKLKSSIVIFICGFDLFEQGRSIYTFKTFCEEDQKIILDDKRTTIFININGSREGVAPELADLLDYLQTSKPTDKFTSRLNGRVMNLRNDFEWRENYMTMEMKMEERFEAGVEKGRKQGLERGIKILYFDVHMSIPDIAQKLEMTEEQVEKIVEHLKQQENEK